MSTTLTSGSPNVLGSTNKTCKSFNRCKRNPNKAYIGALESLSFADKKKNKNKNDQFNNNIYTQRLK